ncbi:hypothetical protein AX15_005664 [Amanita polypyramis BW_CC]|nr:hypothetical protein AX15_005664 [Amanita polypyramis BW_CC]
MEAYHDTTHLWDFSRPADFSQIPEDDFLAMLQKQYPPEATRHINPNIPNNLSYADSVNPQNISSRFSTNSDPTPPSEDSSPSPSLHDTAGGGLSDDSHDPMLKRKAGDDGPEDGGPHQKTQHTLHNGKGSSTGTAVVTSRRKSAGAGPLSAKDESRLLKRKEQNRAAQRAFRERKEKHVKDLEDKVAALEAKNEQSLSENENLRDLLARLQTENVVLKQQQQQQQHQGPFTFSMPKNAAGLELQNRMTSSFVDSPIFAPSVASSSRTQTVLPSPASSNSSPKHTNPVDWSSLTSFDPSMLNVLDDTSQSGATDVAMNVDLGFGTSSDALAGFPFTTIASNPAFFSLASTFDAAAPPHQNDLSPSPPSANPYNFDFGSLAPWPTSSQNDPSFNELFNGYIPSANSGDYNALLVNGPDSASIPRRIEPNSSSSSSVSSAASPGDLLLTPTSEADSCSKGECAKSKDACLKAIEESGPSPFAPPRSPNNTNNLSAVLKKTLDNNSAPMISCSGSKFPKTPPSDKNIEVLTAWRTITSNPKFKVRQRCLTLSLNSLLTRPTN